MIKVSIIIPFFNKVETLRLCLNAIRKQTFPIQEMEVLVVDNGSTVDTDDLKKQFSDVNWLVELKPGSYAARNRGLENSKGEIIAFTDSDCIPAPDWITNAVATLENTDATIIGGKIELVTPSDRQLNICEMLEEELFGMVSQQRLITKKGFAATANVITYRSVFARIGYFDSDLKSSGDKEWVQRAVSQGEHLQYAESVIIYHPRRSTFNQISKKSRRIVGGMITLMKKRNASRKEMIIYILGQSVFNWKLHVHAIMKVKAQGFWLRLKRAVLLELLSMIALAEKLRVLLGGEAYRGD